MSCIIKTLLHNEAQCTRRKEEIGSVDGNCKLGPSYDDAVEEDEADSEEAC